MSTLEPILINLLLFVISGLLRSVMAALGF
jgi:hypothetical protein